MLEETVTVDKLVHGGQAIATLADGRKVFLWGALPGEQVSIELTKSKKDYAEARVVDVLKSSTARIEPNEPNYLATSPWQIIDFNQEAEFKKQIIIETFAREAVVLPSFKFTQDTKNFFGYRNKMEYSFYGDDFGIHMALYNRGTHTKAIVSGSALAMPAIDKAANKITKWLNTLGIRAASLKSLMLRSNQAGDVVATLFIKTESFPKMPELFGLLGFEVYFSNPKSPASLATKKLYSQGDVTMSDKLMGRSVSYGSRSFFQVNVPIFEQVLQLIAVEVKDAESIVDMYSGVGSIGLSIDAKNTTLIELDKDNSELAIQNSAGRAKVINASTEKALRFITGESVIIFDPPRAGLHADVIEKTLEALPPKVIYLSCNPVTQARDIRLLSEKYELSSFTGFNFFPRTPHIETLAVLQRK